MLTIDHRAVAHVGASPFALRLTLEYIGFRVNMHFIATAQQLIDALHSVPAGGLAIIDAHGTEDGLVLEELGHAIAAQQPYVNNMSAANFAEALTMQPCAVVNMGCILGTQAYADAFLGAGCTHYIGATDYPNANAGLLYTQMLGYWLHDHHLSLSDAHARASNIDEQTRYYTLFSSNH